MRGIISYLIIALGAIIAVFIHEFTKALTAYLLGDKSVKNSGQLTLNPLKYIEPIGLIFIIVWGYGWGNPREINTSYFKDRKKGTLITYTMPILANFLFAIIFYNLQFLWLGFYVFGNLSLGLAIFNLIPIYPLCGEKILKYFLNPNSAMKYMQFEPTIRIIVILLIVMGPLQYLLGTVIGIVQTLINFLVFIK